MTSADWVDARSYLATTALAVMLYALYTFHWRANEIRKRSTKPYDDRVGPVRPFRLPKVSGLMKVIHPDLDNPVHCTIGYVLLNLDSRTSGLTHPQRPLSSILSSGSLKNEGIGLSIHIQPSLPFKVRPNVFSFLIDAILPLLVHRSMLQDLHVRFCLNHSGVPVPRPSPQ